MMIRTQSRLVAPGLSRRVGSNLSSRVGPRLSNRIVISDKSGSAYAYGVIWDQVADTYQTGYLDKGVFVEAALTEWPIQEQMRRCVLSDAGARQYYLLGTDSAKKADGSAANIDGTDGQVMVEIPKFWYVQCHYGTKRYFLIGDGPFSVALPDDTVVSATIHPFFYKGGFASASDRYIAAYEGAMWDDSGSAYFTGADIVASKYAAGDKLASVSGQYPKTNETIAEFRAAAMARGTGWHQLDAAGMSALQLLYMTEYGDFNSQSKIGAGRTGLSDGTWTAGSYIAVTGLSNSDGNASGNVSTGGAGGIATDYMSYRGIENWYGHIWKFMDGANVHNSSANRSRLYLCSDYTKYASDTDSGYSLAGLLAETDGYQTDIIDSWVIWPSAVGGSSGTYLCDYYYTYFGVDPDSGWRVAVVGGHAYGGVYAGAFYLASNYGSTNVGAYIGGRLCF